LNIPNRYQIIQQPGQNCDLPPGGHITAPVLKIAISVLDGVRDTILNFDTKWTSENPMVVSNLTYETIRVKLQIFDKKKYQKNVI